MKPLLDAHNHLQDPVFSEHFDDILAAMASEGIARSVVNGTKESDWAAVAELAALHPHQIHPSFGLHPWYAADRSPAWLSTLTRLIQTHPGSGVGECGLDRWMNNHDLDEQREILIPQIALATELNRPLTLHCLKAWGPMLECLQAHPLPARGFLLHAYSGSREMAAAFCDLGAYFSFSGAFLHERKTAQQEVFRHLPSDRLLVETDAPAMPLPAELRTHTLSTDGEHNHPAHLRTTFLHLAQLRNLAPEQLRAILHKNETRFLVT